VNQFELFARMMPTLEDREKESYINLFADSLVSSQSVVLCTKKVVTKMLFSYMMSTSDSARLRNFSRNNAVMQKPEERKGAAK
jgi:hypothetical protein